MITGRETVESKTKTKIVTKMFFFLNTKREN